MEGIGAGAEKNPKIDAPAPRAESAETWQRFVHLASHEGELDEATFAEFIDTEMMFCMQDNPPLSGVFHPDKELAAIKTLPKDEKGIAIELFKDKLARQRHAYMQCRLLIERSIEHDPNVEPDRLKHIESFFGNNYGFAPEYRQVIAEAIEKYRNVHEKVHVVRARFPDDRQLVRELTGVDIEHGDMQLMEGPASIDILTTREVAERLYRKGSTNEKIPEMAGYQGSSEQYGIAFTVTRTDLLDISGTYAHEQEHVKNKLLRPFFDVFDPKLLNGLRREMNGETDPRIRQQLIEEELCVYRDQALDRAKDEITAMLRDGTSNYFDSFFSKDGNAYDYLQKTRETFNTSPLYQRAVQKILIAEYENIIRVALVSLGEFEKTTGYSAEEQIAFLTDIPLERWPNTIRHLEEHFIRYGRETR